MRLTINIASSQAALKFGKKKPASMKTEAGFLLRPLKAADI